MTRRRLVPVVTLPALLFQHHLLVSSFVVLLQSRGSTGIGQSSLDSFAAPAQQVLRESSTFQTPVLCTTRHPNKGICSRCMVTMTSEIHASPTWEGFWSVGLDKGDMWDTGAVSPALQNLLDEGVLPKGRSLVPGCGRGYDTVAFGKSGFDSIGLDLSPTGIEQAKTLLAETKGQLSGKVEFRSGDFFKFDAEVEGKFDVILDYTFLCALDPSVRNDWADHVVSLLSPGGELVTLIFPIVEKEGGPPFAVSESIFSDLLEPRGLEAVHLEKVPACLCHEGREGKTALGRWRFSAAA